MIKFLPDGMASRPGAEVLLLQYIFEILVLVESMVLILVFNVLRFYEYI